MTNEQKRILGVCIYKLLRWASLTVVVPICIPVYLAVIIGHACDEYVGPFIVKVYHPIDDKYADFAIWFIKKIGFDEEEHRDHKREQNRKSSQQ